jgi:hypothetical protein
MFSATFSLIQIFSLLTLELACVGGIAYIMDEAQSTNVLELEEMPTYWHWTRPGARREDYTPSDRLCPAE